MAPIREAHGRRHAKTMTPSLRKALALHRPENVDSETVTLAELSPQLTFVDAPNKATKVFAVTELLEGILLQLARKDVLLCQRVNRTWQDTVTGSIKLQRFLFKTAEKDLGVVALMARLPQSEEMQVTKHVLRDDLELQDSQTRCQLVVPNPLLFFNTDLHNRGAFLRPPSISYADLLAHSQLPYHNITLLEGLFSGTQSDSVCLEMFLTQPPVYEVSVELNIPKCVHCQGKETCCFALSKVKNSKGLRVRDIFAAARSFHFRRPRREGDEDEDVTSISIAFQAVAHGTQNGILLVTAEDMRLAKAEAYEPRPEIADLAGVAPQDG